MTKTELEEAIKNGESVWDNRSGKAEKIDFSKKNKYCHICCNCWAYYLNKYNGNSYFIYY